MIFDVDSGIHCSILTHYFNHTVHLHTYLLRVRIYDTGKQQFLGGQSISLSTVPETLQLICGGSGISYLTTKALLLSLPKADRYRLFCTHTKRVKSIGQAS